MSAAVDRVMRHLCTVAVLALLLTGCARDDQPRDASVPGVTPGDVGEFLASLAQDCTSRDEPLAPKDDPCLELVELEGARLKSALFNHYVENISYPATGDDALREFGIEFNDGIELTQYDQSGDRVEFCVVHPTGAWALFESNQTVAAARGTSGSTCG